MIKALHVALAYLTVAGFVIRAGWSFVAPDLLADRWVRIAPHVVDTMLLALGVTLAVVHAHSLTSGWLAAKLAGLVVYIGCGVLTLRGTGTVKWAGLAGALLAVLYMFAVAYTRSPWPV